MVRGLAQHISESDIEDSIRSCGLQAKEIRLIRKKETGKVIDFQSPACRDMQGANNQILCKNTKSQF